MKSFQKLAATTALLGALACLIPACAQTKGSQGANDLDLISMELCESGAQVDFLKGLVGNFDVTYNVFVKPSGSGEIFDGQASYTWDNERHILVGKHNSDWNGMPFQTSFLMAYDVEQQAYVMGWADQNGNLTTPMTPVTPTGVSGEIASVCTIDENLNRTVMNMQDSTVHTVRRHVKPFAQADRLVVEINCQRQ